MKILKIELQNINSLKSSQPTVIDFESEEFRDVGLFAITGPTGAGKTTILDCIMIALFHKIPRLGSSSYSGTTALEMAISYGAPYAFVTLDFENEGVKYQAHWEVQRESKTGKEIKPKHNYSFKNLTTGDILASVKKTDVYEAIQKVIHLTDKQFLRSVLLAQGEFKAFLKADKKDKGDLLEQITGEEIYKKIGTETLRRVGLEREKLKEISQKINTEDLITPDQLHVFKEEEQVLNTEHQTRDSRLDELNGILNWFVKKKEADRELKALERGQSVHQHELDKSKERLQELFDNNKAEPFRLLITSIKEAKSEEIRISESNHSVRKSLSELEKNIQIQNDFILGANEKKKATQIEFEKWQPILQELVKIENQESKARLIEQDKQKQLDELQGKKEELSNILNGKSEEKETLSDSLGEKKKYLEANKRIPEVEKHYANWQTQLSQLKTKKEALKTEVLKRNKAEEKKGEIEKQLDTEKKALSNLLAELVPLKAEQNDCEKKIAKSNFSRVNKDINDNQLAIEKWKEIQLASIEYKKLTSELETFHETKDDLVQNQKTVQKNLNNLVKRQATEEELFEKAKIIIEQQVLIQKYEEDRKGLQEGEPCSLCGSTEHPFVGEYVAPKMSKIEQDLKEKETVLKATIEEVQNQEKSLVEIKTKLENQNLEITNTEKRTDELQEQVKRLDNSVAVLDLGFIEKQLGQVHSKKDSFVSLIQEIENNQEAKKQLDVEILEKEKSQQEIERGISVIETKALHIKDSIKEMELLVDDLQKEIDKEEGEIKLSFEPFKLKLPTPENTDELLAQIQKRIIDYNSNKDQAQLLSHQVDAIDTELKGFVKQLDENTKSSQTLDVEKTKALKEIATYHTKRIELLPEEIAVEEKRGVLEEGKENSIKSCKLEEQKGQELAIRKTELSSKVEGYKKQLDDLNSKSTRIQSQVDQLLESSAFNSIDEVELILLDAQTKQEIEILQEKLNNETLRLSTLEAQFKKEATKLNQEKELLKITDSEEESVLKREELQAKQKVSSSRLGEIKEKFRRDQELRNTNQEVVKLQDSQQKELGKWEQLYRLLGGSETAFNTYVQRITLKNLLNLANVHLFKLNKRYSLYMSPDVVEKNELDFAMIDHYNSDQVRAIDTASGGEEFLISLALALGLADLTSKNMKINSLFIDEGFGTLDPDSLESAMHTLETLQSDGKLIGLISHVENLKERIPTQIQVTKKSNGVSEVNVVSRD